LILHACGISRAGRLEERNAIGNAVTLRASQ